MYGPLDTRLRPYSPALVKQPATSFGIGFAAGIARRYRKSPVGSVSLNVIVESSGVVIPEIVFALPSLKACMPSIGSK